MNFIQNLLEINLTAFLQLEQNSKLHVGHRTEREIIELAVDDEGC